MLLKFKSLPCSKNHAQIMRRKMRRTNLRFALLSSLTKRNYSQIKMMRESLYFSFIIIAHLCPHFAPFPLFDSINGQFFYLKVRYENIDRTHDLSKYVCTASRFIAGFLGILLLRFQVKPFTEMLTEVTHYLISSFLCTVS